MSPKPIAIYYEHPEWFKPLFAELDRRGLAYDRIPAHEHSFDPAVRDSPYRLVVNRVGAQPSAGRQPGLVLYVRQYLAYLDSIQARVINGHFSYQVGTSKAMQMNILEQLGLGYPRSRVIHQPQQALQAAAGLAFPVVLKPNSGGSGAGIRRFYSMAALEQAVASGQIDTGIDGAVLVQEFLPARDHQIVRVEILDGRFLYAIRLPVVEDNFNYCPADGCHVTSRTDLKIEACRPPDEVIDAAIRIMAAAQTDIGGVEYLVNEHDGQVYYYDINPLSNFVANAPAVVGFDPVQTFVDFIQRRAAG